MSNSNTALIELILFSKEDSLFTEHQFLEELRSWVVMDYSLANAKQAINTYQAAINNENYSFVIVLNLEESLIGLQDTATRIMSKTDSNNALHPFSTTAREAPSQVIIDLDSSIRLVPVERTVVENGVTKKVTAFVPRLIMKKETAGDIENLFHQVEALAKIADKQIDNILTDDTFSEMLGKYVDATVMELQAY